MQRQRALRNAASPLPGDAESRASSAHGAIPAERGAMRRGGWYTATLMKRGMPRHASRIAAATVCATITAGATGCTRPVPVPAAAPIERVMILVFDQMRPDYIDRFSLEHFKHLRAISRNYPDAYVGH